MAEETKGNWQPREAQTTGLKEEGVAYKEDDVCLEVLEGAAKEFLAEVCSSKC